MNTHVNTKAGTVLPVADPQLVSYPFIANTLSVLFAHKDMTLPWFCDRYIQLIINKDTTKSHDLANFYDACGSNNVNTVQYCPFFSSQKIDSSVKNQSYEKFVDFVIEQVNSGYYIHVLLNQRDLDSLLPEFTHQTFIYGYDSGNKKIMMNYFDRIYKYSMNNLVDYDDVENSFQKRQMNRDDAAYKKYISLFKYSDYDYTINLELMNLSIRDYRDSKDSMLKFSYAFKANNDYVFGIDYYHILMEHCKLLDYNFEFKPFQILYEHKLAMKIRLEYLNSIGIINDLSYIKINEYCENLINQSVALRNNAIKYKLSGYSKGEDGKYLNALLNECSELYRLDRDFTDNLILLLS